MSGAAERDESARRIFSEIRALARRDYGANTNALLVVYAVEGFLRRLAASQYADKLTLKGGMLMAAMSARRMTKDADLSTVGVDNDEAVVAAVVAEILPPNLTSTTAWCSIPPASAPRSCERTPSTTGCG